MKTTHAHTCKWKKVLEILLIVGFIAAGFIVPKYLKVQDKTAFLYFLPLGLAMLISLFLKTLYAKVVVCLIFIIGVIITLFVLDVLYYFPN